LLAKAFSHVVSEEEVSVAENEWKLLQTENDDSFLPFEKGNCADHWWRAVFKIKRGAGKSFFSCSIRRRGVSS
jgi:hypothetical protein